MAIRTLIVDDEPPAREKLRALLSKESDLELVGEAQNGAEALEQIEALTPDLVFLDVQMPELDGFAVLKSLRTESMPAVIFVTAHDQFALQAFEVHAVDYLLKPFDRARLIRALDKARQSLRSKLPGAPDPHLANLMAALAQQSPSVERIAVRESGRIIIVKIDQIDWIQAADNYVELHVGKSSHLHRETLTSIEARLPAKQFVRISRSTMVNVDRIGELQPLFHGDYAVILRDGTQLTLSRSFRSKLDLLTDR